MSKTYKVSRVAGWDGWCSPCQRDDRPLVVTRGGPAGMLAWIAGLGDDDRCLLLTCRVCGEWQVVPAREEDDPEVLLEDEVDAEVLETVTAIVQDARSAPAPAPESLPDRMPPRQPAATSDTVGDARSFAEPVLSLPVPPALVLSHAEAGLELADALAAVSLPEQPVAAEPVVEPTHEPVVEAPAASPTGPRPAPQRLVTVPEAAAPAFSAEAVAAAARVLSAARTTSEPAEASAPLDRTRRSRSGPTARRADRPAPGSAEAAAPPAPVAVELPAVLGLPAGSRQVVLAAAS